MWTCPLYCAKPGEPLQSYSCPISQKTALWTCLPPSPWWGNALLHARRCFNAAQYLGAHLVKCTFLNLNLKWLSVLQWITVTCVRTVRGLSGNLFVAWRDALEMAFERFGWISELSFLDYPLTQTGYGAGCSIPACARAEFSLDVCILEENPGFWIRCWTWKLFLSMQCVDLRRFLLYFFLNQEF